MFKLQHGVDCESDERGHGLFRIAWLPKVNNRSISVGKGCFCVCSNRSWQECNFELVPYTFDHLFGEANAIVFVIVPLISLMKDQVSNLNSRGIRAWYVGDDCSEEQPKDILNLKEKIVFGSPEAILNKYQHIFLWPKTKYKMCLHQLESVYSEMVSCLFICSLKQCVSLLQFEKSSSSGKAYLYPSKLTSGCDTKPSD